MNPGNYYELMARYNLLMTERFYALAAGLPDGVRKKDMGGPFSSIHGQFDHLLFGDRAWMRRFTGKEYEIKSVGEIFYEDFETMRREHLALAREILEWASGLEKDWLEKPFRFESRIYKRTRVLPAWMLVTHMFNHQTHHRGQLTTLFEQLGIDFGITDIPFMEGLEDVPAEEI